MAVDAYAGSSLYVAFPLTDRLLAAPLELAPCLASRYVSPMFFLLFCSTCSFFIYVSVCSCAKVLLVAALCEYLEPRVSVCSPCLRLFDARDQVVSSKTLHTGRSTHVRRIYALGGWSRLRTGCLLGEYLCAHSRERRVVCKYSVRYISRRSPRGRGGGGALTCE